MGEGLARQLYGVWVGWGVYGDGAGRIYATKADTGHGIRGYTDTAISRGGLVV